MTDEQVGDVVQRVPRRTVGATRHHDEPMTHEVMAPESLEAFWRNGLLHEVNERVLWPLGLALTLVVGEANDRGRKRDWSTAALRLDTFDHPLSTGMSVAEHRDVHERINTTKADRYRTLGVPTMTVGEAGEERVVILKPEPADG